MQQVQTSLDGARSVFVSPEGYVLLAHYGPGDFNGDYNQDEAQAFDNVGGTAETTTWAPDPCARSGHQRMTSWQSLDREVVMQCGTSAADIHVTARSTSLFTDFQSGDKGIAGTVGVGDEPGWGIVASLESGLGRSSHSTCGDAVTPGVGGIGYCNGPGGGGAYSNHVVSIYSPNEPGYAPDIGCNGEGCNGPGCAMHIWIWLKP